jgi:hypothetical protein
MAKPGFLKLRVSAYPNPLRQRGIVISRFTIVSVNPSLTRRVGMIPCVFGPLMHGHREDRNFKIDMSGCDDSVPRIPLRDYVKEIHAFTPDRNYPWPFDSLEKKGSVSCLNHVWAGFAFPEARHP